MATGDFADIYLDTMNRFGIATTNTTVLTKVKRLINQGLRDWSIQRPWPILMRRAELRTFPDYSTGTVTVTQGSATLTGASTLWNTNNAWTEKNVQATFKFQRTADSEIYEVSSVGSDTAITLLSKYTKATAAAAAYNIWQDEYALASDFDRPVVSRQLFNDIALRPLGFREWRARFSNANDVGKPLYYTLGRNRSGLVRLFLWPAPDRAMILPYEYITSNLAQASGVDQAELSGDTDTPNIPMKYRHMLVHYAVAQYYRDYKDDARYVQSMEQYNDLVRRMANDFELADGMPRLAPDCSKYTWKRKPSPTEWDLGSWFEIL